MFFLGVLVMTFGFVLAMYGKNIFVILTMPFIYTVLENFGWSILGMPQFRFVTAFEPSCLSSHVVTVAYLAVGPGWAQEPDWSENNTPSLSFRDVE